MAITDVVTRYFHTIDDGEYGGLDAIFLPDAIFGLTSAGAIAQRIIEARFPTALWARGAGSEFRWHVLNHGRKGHSAVHPSTDCRWSCADLARSAVAEYSKRIDPEMNARRKRA
jgi:hypothetical protein